MQISHGAVCRFGGKLSCEGKAGGGGGKGEEGYPQKLGNWVGVCSAFH